MAFTPKDRGDLRRARETCHRLAALERAAINEVASVLQKCGLEPRGDIQWITICENADAIRDALEPFDSGVRRDQKDASA